jgi:hypothetical protein
MGLVISAQINFDMESHCKLALQEDSCAEYGASGV